MESMDDQPICPQAILAVVTVGSTSFKGLIDSVLDPDCLKTLVELWRVEEMVVQHGTTEPDLSSLGNHSVIGRGSDESDGKTTISVDLSTDRSLRLTLYRFTPRIDELLARADLVISHAGAGSILAVLRPIFVEPKSIDRHLVIVPNDRLMDDHQSDLAHEIVKAGWATSSSPGNLVKTLEELKRSVPESFKGDDFSTNTIGDQKSGRFRAFLDRSMGFTSDD
ncbi:expressed protein, partial [Phakopsora pachyrhizi]